MTATPKPRYVEHITFDSRWANKRGSGGLAPSKSTIYISNLPFSLTNNDLHKILEKFGRCVKVSIPRDEKRRSKGIAFALFLEREPCIRIINAFNGKKLFGRTLQCSIAVDNGRAREFIRRKEYPDKTRCWECGEFGHLSYKCPKNVLGERRRPRRKKKKRKEKNEDDDYFNPDISLAEAIEEEAMLCEQLQCPPHHHPSSSDIIGSLSAAITQQKTTPILMEHTDFSKMGGFTSNQELANLHIAKQTLLQTQDGDVFIKSEIEVPNEDEGGNSHTIEIQQPVLVKERDKAPSRKKKTSCKRYKQDTYFSDEEILEND